MSSTTRQYLSYPAAAEMLGVKVGTPYCWVSRKQIPHVRLSSRMVRFERAALQGWLDARVAGPREGP